MTISLAFLAPDLVRATVEGRLPRDVGVERSRDALAEWSQQFEALGLNPRQLRAGAQYDALLASEIPEIPAADRRSKPCRGERNFWMQRLEAKNQPNRPEGSPETKREGNDTGENSPQKRPIASRRRDLRFRKTGWWRMQSSETGLRRRNREFPQNFRPKQAFREKMRTIRPKFGSSRS